MSLKILSTWTHSDPHLALSSGHTRHLAPRSLRSRSTRSFLYCWHTPRSPWCRPAQSGNTRRYLENTIFQFSFAKTQDVLTRDYTNVYYICLRKYCTHFSTIDLQRKQVKHWFIYIYFHASEMVLEWSCNYLAIFHDVIILKKLGKIVVVLLLGLYKCDYRAVSM